jgi:hypothetical protein
MSPQHINDIKRFKFWREIQILGARLELDLRFGTVSISKTDTDLISKDSVEKSIISTTTHVKLSSSAEHRTAKRNQCVHKRKGGVCSSNHTNSKVIVIFFKRNRKDQNERRVVKGNRRGKERCRHF